MLILSLSLTLMVLTVVLIMLAWVIRKEKSCDGTATYLSVSNRDLCQRATSTCLKNRPPHMELT
jgi:hypothetical protein